MQNIERQVWQEVIKDVLTHYPQAQASWRTQHENLRSAQSLYEAVAQALRVFREYEWCDLALAASILVRIRQPEVEHRVQIRDFYNWLEAAGKSPAEMSLKNRLRDVLSK